MTRLKEAVSLVLLSWGWDMTEGKESKMKMEGRTWMDHSWRIRHVLLSCIIFEYKQGMAGLVSLYQMLLRRRRVYTEENGEGEAVFSLGEEKGKKFFKAARRRDGTIGKNWPKRQSTLEELVRIAKNLSAN